jgi:hypothetical protein
MIMTEQALHRRWAWIAMAALLAFAVLIVVDARLKAVSGFGTIDLQKAGTVAAVHEIAVAWVSPRRAFLAGFCLGFDYLFMPLYALAMFYGGLAACERFARKRGWLRSLLLFMAALPLAGAIFDAAENALEAEMLLNGATNTALGWAMAVTTAKWLCVAIGLVMVLLGLAGLVLRHAPSEPEGQAD